MKKGRKIEKQRARDPTHHPPIIVYSTSCVLLPSRCQPDPLFLSLLSLSSPPLSAYYIISSPPSLLLPPSLKEMLPFSLLFLFLLALSLSAPSPSSSSSASSSFATSFSSIYEVLKSHGLPMGLLPKGVKDFVVDEKGHFEVHLDRSCNAKFENEVHYDRNVSGDLSYGQIGALSGISAQELFLWFPVKGIRVDIPSSGIIYFDVGVIFKQFSLSLFETPPDCKVVDPPGQLVELQNDHLHGDLLRATA